MKNMPPNIRPFDGPTGDADAYAAAAAYRS
jgi:hypothetical protein